MVVFPSVKTWILLSIGLCCCLLSIKYLIKESAQTDHILCAVASLLQSICICISSSYLFCNASRPIVCGMFYVSSRERCSERIVWQRSVGILYQDTVSSHTNSESNLRIGNGRCRESKVPRMYANSHKLGIVVVLTRSSSSRSRCDWTDCWRDSVGTDEIGILDFRMSKHSANPLTDQFWNLPNPLWRIAGNVSERRKMENGNKRQFYDISRLGRLIIKYSFIFASREDLSLLEKLFKWIFFFVIAFLLSYHTASAIFVVFFN